MHRFGVWGRVVPLGLLLAVGSLVQSLPSAAQEGRATLTIAGRALRCGSVRNVLDPRLPNIGMAVPGLVILNPRLLEEQPATVRLFVFHHECGHHHVGGNEVAADCWATKEGVRKGWLDRRGIEQVCRSFGNRPATPTHPSGVSRCASLQRCFAAASGARAGRTARKAGAPSKASRSGLTKSAN